MFSPSSQRKYWTFGEEELAKYRFYANLNYVKSVQKSEEERCFLPILTPDEELFISRHYERKLRDFLHRFRFMNQLLPKEVQGTTFLFFKRFFAVSSVMDHHPKEIMLTCCFLASKVCDCLIGIDTFAMLLGGDKQLAKNFILHQELEVLSRINFRLDVYTPYRAVEGFLTDLKAHINLRSPERLNEYISRFLNGMWLTDVCLEYAPSQIGLAAIMHATSRCKENIDNLVIDTLMNCPAPDAKSIIIKTVREIQTKVFNPKELPSEEEIAGIESRLAIYRNPNNNPFSEAFKEG